MPEYRTRHAVRALLVSEPGDELLLVQMLVPDSGRRIWLTPGGGIETGELPAAALQREVWEETGCRIEHAGQVVWQRSHTFVLRGEHFEQHETYYWLRVPKFAADGGHNPAQHEAELIETMRWWSLAEIQASEEIFVPLALGRHLGDLLAGRIPSTPLTVGV